MKKIFSYALMMIATAVAFTSCEDDHDSNPVIETPAEFTINTPSVGDAVVDLSKSTSVNMTWSQPKFTSMNAPVVAHYQIQVSPDGTFNKEYVDGGDDNEGCDYASLAETYTKCNVDVPTADIAKALEQVKGWDEDQVPSLVNAKIRVRAYVKNESLSQDIVSEVVSSNTVDLNCVPMYVVLLNADPVMWNLIGDCFGDGSWGDDAGVLTMQPVKDAEYDKKTGEGQTQWIGYLPAGKNFKIRYQNNWNYQWRYTDGDGTGFGDYVMGNAGNGNIVVPEGEEGVYAITLDTKGTSTGTMASSQLTITKYAETVKTYSKICLAGDFNNWGNDGVALTELTPYNTTVSGECHDWTATFTNTEGGTMKFNVGSWDAEWGANAAEKDPVHTLQTGEMYGWGVTSGGSNISLPAGKYKVYFNDITGFFRFTPVK